MSESVKIGFIGAGNMAGAIIGGLIEKGVADPSNIFITDTDKSKNAMFLQKGIQAFDTALELAQVCDYIFLSVKPQNFEQLLTELSGKVSHQKIWISIAAGISTNYIKKMLGGSPKVVRAMPNTPLLVGVGATALSHVAPVSDAEFSMVRSFFDAAGITAVIPEEKMNEIVAVNGSSPAYIYLFADAVVKEAVQQGIDFETAMELFCQTLKGSAKMLLESGSTPEELIKMVSSPGGTTIAALSAFDENSFRETVALAMQRCTSRAIELGR